jgi:hypothetical protein
MIPGRGPNRRRALIGLTRFQTLIATFPIRNLVPVNLVFEVNATLFRQPDSLSAVKTEQRSPLRPSLRLSAIRFELEAQY